MKQFPHLALAMSLFAMPVAACPQYDAVVEAVQSGDTATAAPLYAAIGISTDCDDALREWVGDFLAKESFAVALNSDDPAISRSALNKALGYEPHWRSYAALADLDWDGADYAAAATNYQLAINELVEGDPDHAASNDEIAQVYAMATSALALADTMVEMPKTRSGKILRGTMVSIADGKDYKMPATIDDPVILDEIRTALKPMGYAKD